MNKLFQAGLCLTILVASTGGVLGQLIPLQPAMGEPLDGLTAQQLAAFQQGKQDFNHTLQVSEGLGPIFNQNSCASCHNVPVGGSGAILVTRFGFSDPKAGGFDPLTSLGGSLLQANAITLGCEEVVPPMANVVAQRITPSILGSGLVEAIPDAQITSQAGVYSGAVRMETPFEGGPARVARFGWKAQVPTILTFSADAALNEMGLTNRFVGTENAPNGNVALLMSCDTVPDPEDSPDMQGLEFIDRITNFQRYLAAPPQTPKSGMSGETIFNTIGCGDCHKKSYTTSSDPALESAIQNKTIQPYSDFLLHDMGAAADFIEDGSAAGQEIKTPLLWGLRVRDALWHDGRVTGSSLEIRITGAGGVIDQHNALLSESVPSAQAFQALSSSDKQKVIAFLDSLGKREFDGDGDGDLDHDDLDLMLLAMAGGPYTADDPEAVFDVNQNGTIDQVEFDQFVLVYEEDCNGNGISDLLDILVNGTSPDANGNYIPDECETQQPNLGGASTPGSLTLEVAGDDLTQSGSLASVIVRGAPTGSDLYYAGSVNAGSMSVGTGLLIPSFPFDYFLGPIPAPATGDLFVTIGGGANTPIDWYVQVAAVTINGSLILSNAVQVTTGL